MELKEKLRQILKERYGIENDAEIIKEARALEKDGYKISNAEFSCLVEYAKRKVKIAGKDESYIPILLPDMVKEYFFRMGVNLETMSKMMKE